MYRRVEDDGHRLTLAEQHQLETLCAQLVQNVEKVVPSEPVDATDLEMVRQNVALCKRLEQRILERREKLPDHVPDRFILIKQPMPIGSEFDSCMERMSLPRNRYGQIDKFETDKPLMWPYNDYSTHPIKHVRPFGNRVTQALGTKHVYAVITPDTRRHFSFSRFTNVLNQFSHALVFDWAVPINWHIDLFNYSVVQGPYTDQCAYDIFHKRGGLACLRWNESHEWHQNYEKSKLARVVNGRWLLHLVAPYGRLLNERG